MVTINANNLMYAARARRKRANATANERPGKRLPNRCFISGVKVIDARCGIMTRK